MKSAAIACAAAILSTASPAGADSTIAPTGKLELTGALDISMSSGSVGDPVIIAVDGFYGLTPDFDIGLAHTSPQVSGFLALADGGICLGDACDDGYDSPAVLGRYQLLRGEGLSALVEGGLVVVTFTDPFALSLKLGLRARYLAGALFFDVAPNVLIAAVGRTFEDEASGMEVDFNKDTLNLPIDIGYKSGPLELFLQIGVSGPLDNFVDALLTPIGFGVRFEQSERLGVLGWFSFRDIFNTQPDFELDADIRSAGVSATFRL